MSSAMTPMVAPTPMPAAAPVLRPLLVDSECELPAPLPDCVACPELLEVGNVIPAASKARTGAEGGSNNDRSDCCQATEIGFAKAVVGRAFD